MKLMNELFDDEVKVLKASENLLKGGTATPDELRQSCAELARHYKKLLQLTNKVFRISDINSAETKRAEAVLKALLDNSDQGFLTVYSDLRIGKEYSKECDRILQRKVAGQHFIELLSELGVDTDAGLANNVQAIFAEDDILKQAELIKHLPQSLLINGMTIKVDYKVLSEAETGTSTALMLILTDVTEMQKAEEAIRYLSYHDKVTGLYNRAYAEKMIQEYQAQRFLPLSIVIGDLDGLKLVNDLFGHKAGDMLIISMANVLSSSLRRSDTVARWGGDEFLILLPNTSNTQCAQLCERIHANASEQTSLFDLKISLGYATLGHLGETFSSVFKAADAMMYAEKATKGKTNKKDILLRIANNIDQQLILGQRMHRFVELAHRVADQPLADEVTQPDNLLLFWLLANIQPIVQEIKLDPVSDDDETKSRALMSIGETALVYAYASIKENWDGSGKPQGLKGRQIPLLSRVYSILADYCADLDAGYTTQQALHIIEQQNGSRYDPELVRMFAQTCLVC